MRTSCGPNFIKIRLYLQELWPKKTTNWAQLGQEAKTNSGFRKVNSRTKIIQKLKVVDPETMEKCAWPRACEISCGPLEPAPGGNLCPIFQIAPKLTKKLQGLPNFQNNWCLEIIFFFKILSIKFPIRRRNCFFSIGWAWCPKTSPKLKKGVFKWKKIALKLA